VSTLKTNLDDEVAVLFGNTLNWDIEYMKRQYPVLEEESGFIIDYIEYECPFSEGASSIRYKEIWSQIEQQSPGSKLRFYTGFLKKVQPILRERERMESELRTCVICGEPSFNEICSVCKLKQKLTKV